MQNKNNSRQKHVIASVILALLVSACNSTDSTLGVEQPDTAATPAVAPTAPATTSTGVAVANLAPNPALGNVYFSPIVGAPVANVTALSKRLSTAAAANGIKLQAASSPAINHEIRGYFSALSEGGTTTVIHVWDVFTPQGQRVHRIQGQEKVNATSTEPWAVVPAASMERIADIVLREYSAWRTKT